MDAGVSAVRSSRPLGTTRSRPRRYRARACFPRLKRACPTGPCMREVWGTRLRDAVGRCGGLPRWRADPPPEGGTPWRARGWRGIGPPAGRPKPPKGGHMARRFNRTPLTDEERDARRKADRDRIEQAARALLTTDGWQRWIKVRASNGLSRYSLGNQMILATRRIGAASLDLRRRLPRLAATQPRAAQGRGHPNPRPRHRQGTRQAWRGQRRHARLLQDRGRVGRDGAPTRCPARSPSRWPRLRSRSPARATIT